MCSARTRAPALAALRRITNHDHVRLTACGAADSKFWDEPGVESEYVATFKQEVKRYYYFQQTRRCCYCSRLLDDHGATYDAEHIIDKNTYPQFMFELNNLASSCKKCNGAKGVKPVLVSAHVTGVPYSSSDYLIVHPHLDEWEDHLGFDPVGRIIRRDGSEKGKNTIAICAIYRVNSLTLSDAFSRDDADDAYTAMTLLYDESKSQKYRQKQLEFLRGLAEKFGLAKAKAIVDILESEFGLK